MKPVQRDFLRGSVLALLAGGGAWLLARYAFGQLYYLGALLPAVMVTLLLVAWLMHLREDGFFGGVRQDGPPPPGQERLFAAFDEEVIPRAAGPQLTPRDLLRALLWAAAELGLASIALYHLAGIGAGRFQ